MALRYENFFTYRQFYNVYMLHCDFNSPIWDWTPEMFSAMPECSGTFASRLTAFVNPCACWIGERNEQSDRL
jgi:hypothetical protein